MQTHTEISRQSHNLFNAEEVAETIGSDLETVTSGLKSVNRSGDIRRWSVFEIRTTQSGASL
jgi:hypothetical protein